jgi:hypothetical protein
VSAPVLAGRDDLGRRFYTFGDPPEAFWSVTTIISGGVPKFLHAHYAKMAAELAFDAILERGPYSRPTAIINRLAARGRAWVAERQAAGELTSIKLAKLGPRDLALRWIKGAADRHRDAAAERGSAVHAEAELLVLSHAREAARLYLDHQAIAPWPEDLAAYQRAFVAWVDDFHPEFLAAEASVFNRTQAYAGTLDTIIRILAGDLVTAIEAIGGPRLVRRFEVELWEWLRALDPETPIQVIVDFKTGKAVYAEVALQLAPYARGEFIGAPDGRTELPMIPVDLGAVLHLRADGTYQFRLVRIDESIFAAFCFAREVYRFVNETAKTVLLQDLTPSPAPEPEAVEVA